MRPILLFSFLVFCITTSFTSDAQNDRWVRKIEEQAVEMVPGQRGTFYSLSWQTNCPDDYIVIRFFKPDGTVQHAFKSFVYLGHISTYKAFTNASNHLIMYLRDDGLNHLFYEFDSSGVMLWNNNLQYVNPYVKFESFIPGPNCFYLAGSSDPAVSDTAYAYLCKLNLQGQHVWTKRYKQAQVAGSNVRFHDLMINQDTLFAVGHFYTLPANVGWQPWRPCITKLDTSGALLQSSYYMVDSSFIGFDEYSFLQIKKSTTGSYYLSGLNYGNEHAIFRLDPGLNVQWIQYWSSGKVKQLTAGYNDDVWMIQDYTSYNYIFHMGADGSVLPGHATRSPNSANNLMYGDAFSIEKHDCGYLVSNNENVIMRLDTAMTSCLDSTYTDFDLYSAVTNVSRRSVSLTAEGAAPLGHFITSATYNTIPSTSTSLCTDNLLHCGGSSSTPVISTEIGGIKIYPCPANDYFILEISDHDESVHMSLQDVQGKIQLDGLLRNGGLHRINTTNLREGIYLLIVHAGGHTIKQKIIIGH